MDRFGEMLRRERESRETPLVEVARRTRIGLRYLEALEREDFDGLPGPRGFGKLYIRAYAELLGFDPEPLLTAFERQQLERERRTAATDSGNSHEPRRRRIRYVPPPRKGTPASTGEPPPPESSASRSGDDAIAEAPPIEAGTAPAPVPPASASTAPEDRPPPPSLPAGPPIETRDETPVSPRTATAEAHRPSRRGPLVAVAAGAVLVTIFVAMLVARDPRNARPAAAPDTAEPPASVEVKPATDPPAVVPTDTDRSSPTADTRASDALAAAAAPVEAAAAPTTTSSAVTAGNAAPVAPKPLRVTHHELGGGVTNLRVEDVRRDFVEGSVALFLTRVVGASAGQRVHHVWLRQGRTVQDLALDLGGPDWRTYSTKTLWGTGNWAVEARDGDGSVLARIEFRCEDR